MDIRNTRLEPDTCYHIYNRGINGSTVFFEPKNYTYFLQQCARYVHPWVDTFAYCLLGNHFHLLVRVRSEDELSKAMIKNKEKPIYWHVSNGFSSFFQSYTRAINKMYERTGPLFESPFKRIAVKEEAYFSQLVTYIHHNPVKHGFVTDFRDYAYSSYHAHLGSSDTKLNQQDVLDWFGGEKAYVEFHAGMDKTRLEQDWFLE
jgi:putative transposase